MTLNATGDPVRPSRAAYGLGQLVSLVAEGRAATRADLSRLTGLARSTVSQRVELLVRSDVLCDVGDGPSTGGRRPTLLKLAPGVGVVLAADIGATHCRLAIADLTGNIVLAANHALSPAGMAALLRAQGLADG